MDKLRKVMRLLEIQKRHINRHMRYINLRLYSSLDKLIGQVLIRFEFTENYQKPTKKLRMPIKIYFSSFI